MTSDVKLIDGPYAGAVLPEISDESGFVNLPEQAAGPAAWYQVDAPDWTVGLRSAHHLAHL